MEGNTLQKPHQGISQEKSATEIKQGQLPFSCSYSKCISALPGTVSTTLVFFIVDINFHSGIMPIPSTFSSIAHQRWWKCSDNFFSLTLVKPIRKIKCFIMSRIGSCRIGSEAMWKKPDKKRKIDSRRLKNVGRLGHALHASHFSQSCRDAD